jgi:hypothetical protein
MEQVEQSLEQASASAAAGSPIAPIARPPSEELAGDPPGTPLA